MGWLVVISLFLCGATFLVYLPAVHFDFLNYDDPEYVTENPHVLSGITARSVLWAFTATHACNWHPVSWLSHMVDVELFGQGPVGPHLVNVLLHTVNALLVLVLLVKLTGCLWPSATVAALFALHPLRVESVAWISERKDVLSTFFGLLTLLLYTYYARARTLARPTYLQTSQVVRGKKVLFWYASALFCFALGLMSKPMLVTWPCLMLLLDYWPLNRLRPDGSGTKERFRTVVMEKIPFFALTIASSTVTYIVQKETAAVQSWLPLWARIENAFVSYARYLGKVFWPANLAVPYPHPGTWSGYIVWLSIILVLGTSTILWTTKQKRPYAFVGWFWFIGTLVPVIGLVQVGVQSMADRYTYFPSIGLFIMLCWTGAELITEKPKLHGLAFVSIVVLLVMLATRTSVQLRHWHNTETLFTHTIRSTKNNADALTALGNHMMKLGKFNDARTWYERALSVIAGCQELGTNALSLFFAPTHHTNAAFAKFKQSVKSNARRATAFAQMLNNYGLVLAQKGVRDQAIQWYRAALEIKPDYATALQNLAVEFAVKGDHAKAIELFSAALKILPDEPKVHLGLARSLKATHQFESAIQHFQTALVAFPTNATIHEEIGVCMAEAGAVTEAIKHYQTALKLNPYLFKTRNNLGAALLSLGQYEAAIEQFKIAIRFNPNYAPAYENLGVALAATGKIQDGITYLRTAIALEPDVANAHFNLANLLAQQKKLRAAVLEYRQVLQLEPNHVPALCNLAKVLIELGERAEANQLAQKAYAIAPESPWVRELINLLEQESP